MLLKGKKAVVTGATRGIGKAIAKKFVQEGASVAFFGTNEQLGQEVQKELLQLAVDGAKVQFFKVDVAKTGEVEAALKQAQEALGGDIQILVNNAGITRDQLLMKLPEEDWDAVIDTNLKSVYNTAKVVVRPMLKAKAGRIINITSVSGIIGNPGQTNYAASKAGIIGFTKALSKEVASRGITVNCVAPGFIQTAMTDALNDAQKEALYKEIPMQRMGQPDEIADAVLFLAGDSGSYITGQVIAVDGGISL